MCLLISEFNYDQLLRYHIDSILFNNLVDDGANGDIIFVFGSKKSLKYRCPRAIELYKEKRASKILFSGGVQWDGQHDVEAMVMSEEAKKIEFQKWIFWSNHYPSIQETMYFFLLKYWRAASG